MQTFLDQYQAKLVGPEKFYTQIDKVSFICKCGAETTKSTSGYYQSWCLL